MRVALHARQVFLRRDEREAFARRFGAQRLDIGTRIAMVVVEATRRANHDAARPQRREEFLRIADTGEGEHALAGQ